jgi:hypothetical protein
MTLALTLSGSLNPMSYSTAYRGPAIETDVPPPWDIGHRMRDLLTDLDTRGEDSTDRGQPLGQRGVDDACAIVVHNSSFRQTGFACSGNRGRYINSVTTPGRRG